MGIKKDALKEAFPHTIPIFAGFMFLGISYGIFMNSLGFSFVYPMIMSLLIFAGSMEFLAANLLLLEFNPMNAFLLTLVVNARHLFYGISMLDKYKDTGRKKIYLIFGMCDESFSINSSAEIPSNIDKGWFMFWVNLLNQIYWVVGATIGGIFGSFIKFSTKGIDFVMTALFVVIFLDNYIGKNKKFSSLVGLISSLICLIIFKEKNFILPSMILILISLTFFKKRNGIKEAVL